MAVPKKKTSKSKKNIRKNAWKKKVLKQAIRALSIAKLIEQEEQKKNNLEKKESN
uniref:Large ribosomal subunit protein bL32c n=1 Tax=Koshicola spirodelophila TaxID=1707787 RepID=A0A160E6W3_9CHLO|nr:ribosomal protein L32 [Koshicola spirodelophila]